MASRAPKPRQSAMVHILSTIGWLATKALSWPSVAFVSSALWAAAFAVVAMSDPRGAEPLFLVGNILLTTRLVSWGELYKKRWMATLTVIVVAVAACALLTLAEFRWIERHIIIVRPDAKFELHTGRFTRDTILYVSNETSDPASSVWIQIAIVDDIVEGKSVEIAPDDNIPQHPHPSNPDLAIQDITWYPGTDESRQQSVFVLLNEIPPHTRYSLTVRGTTKVQSFARASIIGFSLLPSGYGRGSGVLTHEMILPQTLRLEGPRLRFVKRIPKQP